MDRSESSKRGSDGAASGKATADWTDVPLEHLVDFLVATHRNWRERILPALEARLERLADGDDSEATLLLRRTFTRLATNLDGHCRIEEQVLFPAIVALERSQRDGAAAPKPKFGSLRNPIAVMEREHEDDKQYWANVENLAAQHSKATNGDDEESLCGLLARLHAEVDAHTHLESGILFPRALRLERDARAR